MVIKRTDRIESNSCDMFKIFTKKHDWAIHEIKFIHLYFGVVNMDLFIYAVL